MRKDFNENNDHLDKKDQLKPLKKADLEKWAENIESI